MSAASGGSASAQRRLADLDLGSLRRLDGRFPGRHRTRALGSGTELADLRAHLPDDDVRHIDWHVTARLGEPYVRRFHDDRELTAWFVVDRSPSMDFGSTPRRKRTVAAEASVALASSLVHGRDRVGAVLHGGDGLRIIEPGSSWRHVQRLGHELARSTAERPAGNMSRSDPLAAMLSAIRRVATRRSLIVVLSDFIDGHDWVPAMRILTSRHDVMAIEVVDPHERELPEAGIVVFQDLESGAQLTVDTSDTAFRRRFAAEVAKRDDALAAAAASAGLSMHRLSTDDDLMRRLLGIASRRRAQAER